MGFWDKLWEGATGQGAKKEAKAMQKEAAATAGGIAKQAGTYGAGYDTGTAASMGANAAEYMRKANEAAQAQASQAAQAAATQGSRASLQAARTAGINPGQAAMAGAQQAGNIYGQNYQQGLESGRQQYQQGTQQFGQQGAEMAQRGLQGAGLQAGIGGQLYGQARQKGQDVMGGIGQVAGALGGLLSDERAKDIGGAPDVAAILAKIRPIRFRYKQGPQVERIGVTAQNLEQTPLASTVVDTPEGKKIDTDQLSGANVAMLGDLAKRILALEQKIGGQA